VRLRGDTRALEKRTSMGQVYPRNHRLLPNRRIFHDAGVALHGEVSCRASQKDVSSLPLQIVGSGDQYSGHRHYLLGVSGCDDKSNGQNAESRKQSLEHY